MPLYDYICSNCGHRFETKQGIKDGPLTNCPACATPNLERAITTPLMIIDTTPKTLGTLAERNKKNIGSYELDKLGREHKTKKKQTLKLSKGMSRSTTNKERPFWRDSDKPLNLNKIEDVGGYIENG